MVAWGSHSLGSRWSCLAPVADPDHGGRDGIPMLGAPHCDQLQLLGWDSGQTLREQVELRLGVEVGRTVEATMMSLGAGL